MPIVQMVTAGWPPLSHLGGIGLLTALLAASAKMPTLILGTASTLVLLIVAIWESTSLKRERATLKSAADDRAHAPDRNTP
jgi:low temperature requirement protein LtrA